MQKKKRIEYIDMLRVSACFLVLLTHSVMPNMPENGKWLGMMSVLCSPSSELFLAVSGAVLLPVHATMREFYGRRFSKLLPPMLAWSIFGIVLRYIQGKMSGMEAIESCLLIPFGPAIDIYWFLYVMIGLYLFAPFISYWLRETTQRQMQLFLGIWALNMLIPWINLLKPGLYDQDGSYYWILCYFGGFLGYWILGCYLRKYPPSFRSWTGRLIVLGSVLYLISIVLMRPYVDHWTDYWDNLQIGSAFLVALIFMVVKRIADTRFSKKYLNSAMSFIATYSFGIYLLHPFVIRDGVWHLFVQFRVYNHPIFESVLITVISIVLCIGIIKAITSVYKPAGKWLFGLS